MTALTALIASLSAIVLGMGAIGLIALIFVAIILVYMGLCSDGPLKLVSILVAILSILIIISVLGGGA